VGRLIEEAYPDFEKVIPKDNPIGIAVERKLFLEALQRAQITAAEESDAVILNVEGNQLKLSSQAAEKGEAHEILPFEEKSPICQDQLSRGVSHRCIEASAEHGGAPVVGGCRERGDCWSRAIARPIRASCTS
jgi:hypothetical protein